MSNAVYHRAYDEREPIEVRVENDQDRDIKFSGNGRTVRYDSSKV